MRQLETDSWIRWQDELALSRIKAMRFDDLCKILAPAATANETPEETAKRLVSR